MIQGFNTFPGKYSSELFMFVIHGVSVLFLRGICCLLKYWNDPFLLLKPIYSLMQRHERSISLFSLIHQQCRLINTTVNGEK